MFFFPDMDAIERRSAESARTTHSAPECVDACRLVGRMIGRALAGLPTEDILFGDAESFAGAPAIAAIARGAYRDKGETQIRGDGYVVNSLEAALWCFLKTRTFAEAALLAANLGDDADTTAAVCGQLAGACYGMSAVPASWLERLALREEITRLADQLYLKQTTT
jgi:ADP-ribosyl-[dinitrogen reductase] hydrolase